jgi:hypothetical protein
MDNNDRIHKDQEKNWKTLRTDTWTRETETRERHKLGFGDRWHTWELGKGGGASEGSGGEKSGRVQDKGKGAKFWDKEPGVAYYSSREKMRGKGNMIYALKDRSGQVRHGTKGVLDIATDFYRDLFTKGPTDGQVQDRILGKIDKG